jgi:hypothetical protein
VRGVQHAVADGIGSGGVGKVVVPVLGIELAGDDGRAGSVAVLENFEEVAPLSIGDRSNGKIIELCAAQHNGSGDCGSARGTSPAIDREGGRRGSAIVVLDGADAAARNERCCAAMRKLVGGWDVAAGAGASPVAFSVVAAPSRRRVGRLRVERELRRRGNSADGRAASRTQNGHRQGRFGEQPRDGSLGVLRGGS